MPPIDTTITAKKMSARERDDAFDLLAQFLSADEHYRDSSAAYGDGGPAALRNALDLFLSRPEHGFVWMVYEADRAVGCCVVCYAISTSAGGIVAKLDDVSVRGGQEGKGIGSFMLASLAGALREAGIRRIDTSCHLANDAARRFYLRQGFLPLNEERLARVL